MVFIIISALILEMGEKAKGWRAM